MNWLVLLLCILIEFCVTILTIVRAGLEKKKIQSLGWRCRHAGPLRQGEVFRMSLSRRAFVSSLKGNKIAIIVL